MAAGLRPAWAELAHHATQPVRPVAGTEGFAIVGNALNEDFFDGGEYHLVEGFSRAKGEGIARAALPKYYILYKT